MAQHILVAGRSDKNLELVRQVFEDLDYLIVPAKSMSLALFLAQKNSPILVVSGAELDDGEIVSFVHELQIDKDLKAVPILLLLESAEKAELENEMLKAGVAAVIDNKIPVQDLWSRLSDYLVPGAFKRELRPEETTE